VSDPTNLLLLLLFLHLLAVSNIIMALPAAAEAGKLFDFNLTLPISEWQQLKQSGTAAWQQPAAAWQ
jgi:hypothetical protein